MKYILFQLFLFFLVSLVTPVQAIYDPLSVPNNKFGIHVADPNDINDAAKLVNSTGGDWGYLTMVIPDNDRDLGKWQTIFHTLKKAHLIPIVRIATHVEYGSWKKASSDHAAEWAGFLDELPWPTTNRYIIVFNEPNHAKEWGGEIRPGEYAQAFVNYAKTLKTTSEDFYVLPAGLDFSAPNTNDTGDAATYLREMLIAQPQLFELADGWTSHSYPNPGFMGSPTATGRGTIASFAWELELLKSLGVSKDLPIFITETGWAHTGDIAQRRGLSPEKVAEYMQVAAQNVWSDPKIVAVTPFLLQYPESLFSMFSWLVPYEKTPYAFYTAYQTVGKTSGSPQAPPTQEYLALLASSLTL